MANGGPYQLSARARDAATNQTTSTAVSVTVNNANLGLVAAYSFNEGSRPTLADAIGRHGRTGTLSGATWTAQGKFGGAFAFDGMNDWVTVPITPRLDFTNALTLEAWVFPTAWAVAPGAASSSRRRPREVYHLYANTDTNAPYVLVRRPPRRGSRTTRGHRADPGEYLDASRHDLRRHDAAVLCQRGSGRRRMRSPNPLLTSTGVLRMGGNSIWGEFFTGRIDEVRLYNRALSVAEIQADMNGPIQP